MSFISKKKKMWVGPWVRVLGVLSLHNLSFLLVRQKRHCSSKLFFGQPGWAEMDRCLFAQIRSGRPTGSRALGLTASSVM